LIGFIAVKILASGFSARHDLQTPVRHGIYAMIANLLLGLLLVIPSAQFGWGHAALAMATALAALFNAGLLLRGLLKAGVLQPKQGWWAYAFRLVLGNLAMGLLLAYFAVGLPWSDWSSHQRIAQLILWISVGGAAYFACLWLCGLRPHHLALREA
jgi:putative peptidoglycan lipid II flippase